MAATDQDISKSGFRLVIRSGTVTKELKARLLEGLNAVGEKYKAAVMETISLDDHSLKALRELGSPYARRGGSDIHGDDRLVHVQSGRLRDSIKLTSAQETSTGTYTVSVTSDAPEVKFLLAGTSKMRPRRFDEKAIEEVGGRELFGPLVRMLQGFRYKIKEF